MENMRTFKNQKFYQEELESMQSQNISEALQSAQMLATDGSGGPHWVPREARKHASAVITLATENDAQGNTWVGQVGTIMLAGVCTRMVWWVL